MNTKRDLHERANFQEIIYTFLIFCPIIKKMAHFKKDVLAYFWNVNECTVPMQRTGYVGFWNTKTVKCKHPKSCMEHFAELLL